MIKTANNKARSAFYIVFVSGLLSATSFIIMMIWNNSISGYFNYSELSFLECVGIVSFVYVIYFGIKFGHEECKKDRKNENLTEQKNKSANMSNSFLHHKPMNNISKELLSKISAKDKEEINSLLSKCCGFEAGFNQSKSKQQFKNNI